MAIDAGDEVEVDVVDRRAVAETVDQVQRRAADAFDRRQAQFHRARLRVHRLRAELERAPVRLLRILDAEGHAARRRPVLGGEIRREAQRLAVDDEVDVALTVQRHVLRTVLGDAGEAQQLEGRLEHIRGRGREFDEFEAHQPHRIVKEIGHCSVSCVARNALRQEAGQSILTPAFLTSFAYLSCSERKNATATSGVLGLMTLPCFAIASVTSGVASAAAKAA